MAQMAHPYRNPTSGVYYLRRQIPAELRPAFGGRSLYQKTLGTRDYVQAARLFTSANAQLESQFETARQRLATTGDCRPSQVEEADALIRAYFEPEEGVEGGLNGPERLVLAFIEIDRGLLNAATAFVRLGDGFRRVRVGCTAHPPSDAERWWALSVNALAFRTDPGVQKALTEQPPASIWRSRSGAEFASDRLSQAQRVAEQISRFTGRPLIDLPAVLASRIVVYLDAARLAHEAAPRKREGKKPTLRPLMKLEELHREWSAACSPRAQTAAEVLSTVKDFTEYFGDIPVSNIERHDLTTFGELLTNLPSKMSKADRALPFSERIQKFESHEGPYVTYTTVKKRVGGLQWLLSFGLQKGWLSENVGTKILIAQGNSRKSGEMRSFLDSELKGLFSSWLFLEPAKWDSERTAVSHSTMFWILLIALTSGARLEEIGQCLTSDVIDDDGLFIEITDYVSIKNPDLVKKVKNDGSRRFVPVHSIVINLGFQKYLSALKEKGEERLFPELKANVYKKWTQAASQKINRYIDRYASSDSRVKLHCLRHNFKNFADEAGIPERVQDQICGHTPVNVGRRYGWRGPTRMLRAQLERIKFDRIDFPAIRAATADVEWAEIIALLRR